MIVSRIVDRKTQEVHYCGNERKINLMSVTENLINIKILLPKEHEDISDICERQ
jgi:hypothetical protein